MIKIFRRQDLGYKLIALTVAAVIAWVIYTGYQRQAQLDAFISAYTEERKAVQDRGETPVGPDPSELLKDPSLRGETGRGISSTQTEGCYVRLIFTDNTKDRVGPFCGKDGKDGKDGKPGPVGSPGVSITDVVTDGCIIVITLSNGQKVRAGPFCGRDGKDGKDGAKGEPGRGISDSECRQVDDGKWRWRIDYDDGTTDEDAGPCNGSGQGRPSPTISKSPSSPSSSSPTR